VAWDLIASKNMAAYLEAAQLQARFFGKDSGAADDYMAVEAHLATQLMKASNPQLASAQRARLSV
jgi:hypothetical protein